MSPITRVPLEDAAGHCVSVTHSTCAGGVSSICTELREQHRQRQDLHRAEKSLTLQIKAKCRRLCGGDKDEAGKIYDAMTGKKGASHDLAETALMASLPFIEARQIIEGNRKPVERRMEKLAGELPVAAWVKDTRGFGLLGLASVIGECGDLSVYSNPAKVWKRMGLAPIEKGGKTLAAATWRTHGGLNSGDWEAAGYSPVRRSIMWNIGSSIIKAGGPLREIYDARKALEIEKAKAEGLEVRPAAKIPAKRASEFRSAGHVHNRAQRYIEKRLLRELWRAWTGSAAPQNP